MAEKRYMVHRPDGTQDGPYSWDQMYDLALRGELRPGTEVSDATTGERGRADSIPGICSGTSEFVQPPTSLDGLAGILTLLNAAFMLALWVLAARPGSGETSRLLELDSSRLIPVGVRCIVQAAAGVSLLKGRRAGHVVVIAMGFFGTLTPIRPDHAWLIASIGALAFLIFIYSCLRMTGCIGEPPRR